MSTEALVPPCLLFNYFTMTNALALTFVNESITHTLTNKVHYVRYTSLTRHKLLETRSSVCHYITGHTILYTSDVPDTNLSETLCITISTFYYVCGFLRWC